MVSDFIVNDRRDPFVRLNEDEFREALQNHLDLIKTTDLFSWINLQHQSLLQEKTTNLIINQSWINLKDFIKYSKRFQEINYRVDILVDNTTTHTKRHLDVNIFAKSPNKSCPVNELKWKDENDNEQTVNCYFTRGDLKGQSKGLFHLCKELDIIDQKMVSSQITLKEFRNTDSKHTSF